MGIKTAGKLILASASPRRKELLKLLGLHFDVLPSGIEETSRSGETPEEHVLRLSTQKVFALSSSYPEAWVIGADTVVVLDGGFMGKPATIAEAKIMLKKLSGREHQVYTGFAIARKITDILLQEAVISSVFFKRLSEEEVNWYVETDEPYDKAGGYALQGRGAFFISRITGSYTNVIGLPLCEAVNLLKSAGAIEFPG